jgi:hypothetical protein
VLKTDLTTLALIDKGCKPVYVVTIYFQQPETYTKDDYLSDVGDISVSMSDDAGYEIGNVTITLLNRMFYFSRKFANEFPDGRLIEVGVTVGESAILLFRGIISSGWKLTADTLTLQVTV